MFGEAVMNVPKEKFDSLADSEALSEPKKAVEGV